MEHPVLLTVRGVTNSKSIDEARALHNATAGSPEGIEAARSLSDLSHTVYVPASGAGDLSGAKPGELLFLDQWADPKGLERFFSDKDVQASGRKLFASRDGSVWMPARGGFSFHVPAVSGKPARFVGLFRAAVRSAEDAVAAFARMVNKNLAVSRRRGHLSHALYVKLGAPTDPVEVLGIDFWSTIEGLKEHYGDAMATSGLRDVLAGAPAASVWEQSTGFSEW
jgi:hypothetical protein